ncbi:MAG: hypothetical protein ACJAS4_000647 [Bacteriovoracaceae bacterium]
MAIADRISGSTFSTGKLIKISTCNKDSKPSLIVVVEFQLDNGRTIKSNIRDYTKLTKAGKKIECSNLKSGQKVKVGYAEGDDTGLFVGGYQIIDSVEILN